MPIIKQQLSIFWTIEINIIAVLYTLGKISWFIFFTMTQRESSPKWAVYLVMIIIISQIMQMIFVLVHSYMYNFQIVDGYKIAIIFVGLMIWLDMAEMGISLYYKFIETNVEMIGICVGTLILKVSLGLSVIYLDKKEEDWSQEEQTKILLKMIQLHSKWMGILFNELACFNLFIYTIKLLEIEEKEALTWLIYSLELIMIGCLILGGLYCLRFWTRCMRGYNYYILFVITMVIISILTINDFFLKFISEQYDQSLYPELVYVILIILGYAVATVFFCLEQISFHNCKEENRFIQAHILISGKSVEIINPLSELLQELRYFSTQIFGVQRLFKIHWMIESGNVISNLKDYKYRILLFDVSERDSWEQIKNLEISSPLMLVGTNCELHTQRQVSFEEGYNLAKKYGTLYLEVSPKNAFNINESYVQILKRTRQMMFISV